MRRWTKQIRALELFGEKNRLGRGSNLGQAGGNLCLWSPERFFSIVRNAQYTYLFFGRALFLTPVLLTRSLAQKRGFISEFSRRFFPNTPAKISDKRGSEHEVLHEIA